MRAPHRRDELLAHKTSSVGPPWMSGWTGRRLNKSARPPRPQKPLEKSRMSARKLRRLNALTFASQEWFVSLVWRRRGSSAIARKMRSSTRPARGALTSNRLRQEGPGLLTRTVDPRKVYLGRMNPSSRTTRRPPRRARRGKKTRKSRRKCLLKRYVLRTPSRKWGFESSSFPLSVCRKRRPRPNASARNKRVSMEKSTLRSKRHLPQTPSAIVRLASHSFFLPWPQSLRTSCPSHCAPSSAHRWLLSFLSPSHLLRVPAPEMHSDPHTRPSCSPRSRRPIP